MPPQFLGNPYEREWESDTSDLDIRDEEEITLQLPNNIETAQGRDGQNLIVDILDDEDYDVVHILNNFDDEYPSSDSADDEEYHPDEMEDSEADMTDASTSSDVTNLSFHVPPYEYDDDVLEYEDEIDYVTYPLPNETSNNSSKTTTTTAESNSNNLTSDTDTD